MTLAPTWWRRGESNSRPKTLPQELLRAQTVILGVLLSQFPFLPASRHADGSGELHRSWPVQSFAGARAPRNDACSRAVVLPGQTGKTFHNRRIESGVSITILRAFKYESRSMGKAL